MPVVMGYAIALLAGVSFVFQQVVNSNLREDGLAMVGGIHQLRRWHLGHAGHAGPRA